MSDFIRKNPFLTFIVASLALLGAWGILIIANNWDDPGKKAFNRYRGTIAGYSAEVQQNLFYSGEERSYVILTASTDLSKFAEVQAGFRKEEGEPRTWGLLKLCRQNENGCSYVRFPDRPGAVAEGTTTTSAAILPANYDEVEEAMQILAHAIELVVRPENIEKPGPVNPAPDPIKTSPEEVHAIPL